MKKQEPRASEQRMQRSWRICWKCGCTNTRACHNRDGSPCYWVETYLCSACAEKAKEAVPC